MQRGPGCSGQHTGNSFLSRPVPLRADRAALPGTASSMRWLWGAQGQQRLLLTALLPSTVPVTSSRGPLWVGGGASGSGSPMPSQEGQMRGAGLIRVGSTRASSGRPGRGAVLPPRQARSSLPPSALAASGHLVGRAERLRVLSCPGPPAGGPGNSTRKPQHDEEPRCHPRPGPVFDGLVPDCPAHPGQGQGPGWPAPCRPGARRQDRLPRRVCS